MLIGATVPAGFDDSLYPAVGGRHLAARSCLLGSPGAAHRPGILSVRPKDRDEKQGGEIAIGARWWPDWQKSR